MMPLPYSVKTDVIDMTTDQHGTLVATDDFPPKETLLRLESFAQVPDAGSKCTASCIKVAKCAA